MQVGASPSIRRRLAPSRLLNADHPNRRTSRRLRRRTVPRQIIHKDPEAPGQTAKGSSDSPARPLKPFADVNLTSVLSAKSPVDSQPEGTTDTSDDNGWKIVQSEVRVEQVKAHTRHNNVDIVSLHANTEISSSNESWGTGKTPPTEVILHQEAVRQYKSIDLNMLKRIAERVKNGGTCDILTTMTRIGAFNIVIFLAFDDEAATRWVARFPVTGLGGLTPDNAILSDVLESMVTTMRYVSESTSIPVPKVHHWSGTSDNELGRPYVLMDATKGNSLYELENAGFEMSNILNKLSSFVDQWAMFNAELAALQFDRIGSLRSNPDGDVVIGRLCNPWNIRFATLLGADTFRGPFNSVAEYLLITSDLMMRGQLFRQHLFPYTYEDFLKSKLIQSLLPFYVDMSLLNGPFVLSHVDIDLQNILIDEKDGCRITGIVDWDLAAVVPLQSHLRMPDMLMCDQWTKSRQNRKAISEWQIQFARTYRDHYKSCLIKHLHDRRLDYPVHTLLETGYLYSRFERAIFETPPDDEFDELWKYVYSARYNWTDLVGTMLNADWGTVMAEKLSLQLEPDQERIPNTIDMEYRSETEGSSLQVVRSRASWGGKIMNKLRWCWWYVAQCLLCQMDSRRVQVLMHSDRVLSPRAGRGDSYLRKKNLESEKPQPMGVNVEKGLGYGK